MPGAFIRSFTVNMRTFFDSIADAVLQSCIIAFRISQIARILAGDDVMDDIALRNLSIYRVVQKSDNPVLILR